MDDKLIEKMIANGEIGTMTECAYGSAIADTEANNTLKKKKNPGEHPYDNRDK